MCSSRRWPSWPATEPADWGVAQLWSVGMLAVMHCTGAPAETCVWCSAYALAAALASSRHCLAQVCKGSAAGQGCRRLRARPSDGPPPVACGSTCIGARPALALRACFIYSSRVWKRREAGAAWAAHTRASSARARSWVVRRISSEFVISLQGETSAGCGLQAAGLHER